MTALIIVMLGVLALGLLGSRPGGGGIAPIVTLVVLFPPLAVLSKTFGDRGGRVDWHDSVNRIWMHMLLVVVLLAIVAIAQRWSEDRVVQGGGPRSGPLLAVVILIAMARLWDPTLVLEESRSLVLAEPSGPPVEATAAIGPLDPFVHIARVDTVEPSLLRRAKAVDLCADIRFGTFARDLVADLEAEVQLRDDARRNTIDGASVVDVAYQRVCWLLGPGPDAGDVLAVQPLLTITSQSGSETPAVLLTADGEPDIRWSLVWEEPLQWNAWLVRQLPRIAAVLLSLSLVLASGRVRGRGSAEERARVSARADD